MATPRTNGASSGREHGAVSSHRGRGRGGRGYRRDPSDARVAKAKSGSSEPSERSGNQGKHPSRGGGGGRTGGRGERGGRGKSWAKARNGSSRQQAVGVLQLLPEDVVTQSLLPFFVWHDTSAIACVCKPWSVAVRHARQQHSEWKTHAFPGDNVRECMAKLSRALARGARSGSGNVRFPPTFALVTLSFADVQANARYTESFWSDLVDTVVTKDVLPVGCVLVGLLTGHRSRGIDEVTEGPDAPVCLTVSVGHFANTTVETAAFDRKVLRWSASGLTEELECPFERGADPEVDLEKTSLLLWSKNAKPAQALLELSSQWFPDAPVGGAVLSLGDHAPPLMTFTRSANADPKRSKLQGRRKPKTTTLSGGGVLSCPSTLLLRIRGDVSVKPFSLCLDRPITPVLKNLEVPSTEDFDLMRQDCRLYNAVTVVDSEAEDTRTDQSVRLVDVIRELTRSASEELIGLKLYASSSPEMIRSAFKAGSVESYDAANEQSDQVKPLPLFVGERGALTVVDHWPTGSCGVVTIPYNDQMMASVAEAHVKKILKSPTERRVFGAFVSLSRDAQGRNSVSEALRRGLDRTPCHESAVDDGIAPLLLPSGITHPTSRPLVNATTGFILYS